MLEVINCAPDPHIGESKTLSFLRNRLTAGYHVVLTNYYLDNRATTLEIDLVVINRFGVFVLEVKDWYGRIVADDIYWQQEGRGPVSSPITSIDRKAKVMHGFLAERGLGRVSVNALVVLSRGTQMLEISDPRRDRVFALDRQLIEALTTDRYQAFRRPPLSRGDIDRIRDVIVRDHVNPERSYIGKYRILRELRREPGLIEYEAQHAELNRRVRVKAFQVLEIVSQKQLAEEVRRFRRDIEALDVAGSHPNLVSPYDFFKDEHSDEFYYLVLEWIDGEPLENLLERGDSVALAVQVAWMRQLASALGHVHRRGIVHRNVAPPNIYLTDYGSIKLGNFDFAKVPALGKTISVTGVPLVGGRHAAPETLTKPRDVDGRADLYSMGMVWLDLLGSGFPHAEDDQERLLEGIPKEVQTIVRKLIATRRNERYQSADRLVEDLDMLAQSMD